MATYPKQYFQIHNYSFEAIKAFVLEVKKYPIIYMEHTKNNDSPWSEITRKLLGNGTDSFLTPSQIFYWKRIYRGLWMWMRHIFTKDLVERYLGHAGLSQNPKYVWLEYLNFFEPFIKLGANSFYFDADLDAFIDFQVLSSDETAISPYSQYMVYWKHFQEDLVPETYYILIRVCTTEYTSQQNAELELG